MPERLGALGGVLSGRRAGHKTTTNLGQNTHGGSQAADVAAAGSSYDTAQAAGKAPIMSSKEASLFNVPWHSLTPKVLLWYPSCGWSSVYREGWT
jgi:hypothetical protein